MGDLDSALDGYRQVRARAHLSGHELHWLPKRGRSGPVARRVRARAHLSGHELHWLAKLGLAAGFAGFTALMAQVSIPVPWTPVPLSLVILGVLLSGTTLGARWGAVSMGLYLLAGALGLHVFAEIG